MVRRPPRSTLFPTRRSSDLGRVEELREAGGERTLRVAVAGGDGAWIEAVPHAELLSRGRSEEHTSELQSHVNLVCRLLLEKKKKKTHTSLSAERTVDLEDAN